MCCVLYLRTDRETDTFSPKTGTFSPLTGSVQAQLINGVILQVFINESKITIRDFRALLSQSLVDYVLVVVILKLYFFNIWKKKICVDLSREIPISEINLPLPFMRLPKPLREKPYGRPGE